MTSDCVQTEVPGVSKGAQIASQVQPGEAREVMNAVDNAGSESMSTDNCQVRSHFIVLCSSIRHD